MSMTSEPDDPTNPSRPKPPTPYNAFTAAEEVAVMANHFHLVAGDAIKNGDQLAGSLRDFIAFAFMAETGYKATEVMGCMDQVRGPAGGLCFRFWFEKQRDLTDVQTLAAANPQARITELTHQLAHLTNDYNRVCAEKVQLERENGEMLQEIRSLKQKAGR